MTESVSRGSRRRRPRRFSKKGDTGYTSLLGGPGDPINKYRVPKYHPRPETYGALDETSAALSMCRASTKNQKVKEIVSGIQDDFVILMAEIATSSEAYEKSSFRLTPDYVRRLENFIAELQEAIELPTAFITSASTFPAATLELARTTLRRAERWAAKLRHENIVVNDEVLRYINRCADLLWVLARYEEAASKG